MGNTIQKILFVVDAFRGGAGNVIQILAREFKSRGYDCTILLVNGKRAEPKYDLTGIEIIDYKLDEHIITSNPIERILKYKAKFREFFHSVKPDAIISFLTENNILSCMANDMDIPLVISERIDPSKTHTKIHWRMLRRLYYGKAEAVVVQCSNFMGFCGGQFSKITKVIPNPILNPEINYQVDDKKEKTVFISIGRITAQKNFPWMFDQMKQVHKLSPNSKLLIYGDGDQKEYLSRYIKENNMDEYIELMGYTNNPYKELINADVYLMTSDYEGFPNALSEAMAVGLPSITRLCHKGIKDLVKDGVNGFVVKPDDKEGFVQKAVELTQNLDLRKQISENAKKVSETFSVKNITDIWERLLLNTETEE